MWSSVWFCSKKKFVYSQNILIKIVLGYCYPINTRRPNKLKMWFLMLSFWLQVIFLLGRANSTFQPLIEREADEFGDILQGTFIDSYRNLTYKHAMGLRWVTTACPSADFILKTDDDVFVNTAYLESYLPTLPHHQLILCPLIKDLLVQRSYRWCISLNSLI